MSCDGTPASPDCAKLREAVDEAAGVAGTLWISYIFLLFYVLLAIVGVTHADQFLENNVKLPFLQIELPMLGFFWIGPVIVLLAHAYVLHHLNLVADKARELNQLTPPLSDDRLLLGINLFAQMLAGPIKTANAPAWWVEQIIVWVTLVVVPVLTLMYFELHFLPSHNELATWWARFFMIADLALLWCLWPRAICRIRPAWFTGQLAPVGVIVMGLLTAATSYVAILLGTFPGEQWEKILPFVPGHESLVVGVREATGDKRLIQPLWPNSLFVQGIDVVDHKQYDTVSKIAMAPVTKSMRDRHLEYATIIEAQLARVDFTNAHLKGASLVRAHAMGAWFNSADLSGAQLDYAELQGASFFAARLAGATMDSVQFQGGSFAGANLRGAWMQNARFDGASLAGADLRLATLDKSWLVGASFKDADLQGASLADTHLEAASLEKAYIWRTDFSGADAGKGLSQNVIASPMLEHCLSPPNYADTCADTPETLKALVLHDIPNTSDMPDGDSRKPLIARLDMNLSPEQTEARVDDSQKRLASFKLLRPEDRSRLWENIACIGKGAPFIINNLIDTYDDALGWTRPTTQEDTKEMVKYLLDPTKCTATLAVTSEAMKMDLLDLWLLRLPTSIPQPPDH